MISKKITHWIGILCLIIYLIFQTKLANFKYDYILLTISILILLIRKSNK